MLAPKSMPLKKIALYSAILIVLLGGTVFTLYNSLYANKRSRTQNKGEGAIKNTAIVEENLGARNTNIQEEIDFLSSEKFKRLRGNPEAPETTAAGNNNPFISSSQK